MGVEFLTNLADVLLSSIFWRKIGHGKELLAQNERALEAVPAGSLPPRLFFALACWVEYFPAIRQMMARHAQEYDQRPWPDLTMRDFGTVKAGAARLAYHEGRDTDVQTATRWVRDNAYHLSACPELLGTVDLTEAQSLKRQGLYPRALETVTSALKEYSRANLEGMIAVTKVLEGWLLLQTGHDYEASQSWAVGSKFLLHTDDAANCGNIKYYEARQLARWGLDKESREAHRAAAEFFTTWDLPSRNLRRVLFGLADLELRMAVKDQDPAQAADLRRLRS